MSYATFMNVAVSIPTVLSEEAEDLARQLHKTLSQVISEALSDYLARHGQQANLAAYQRRQAGEALLRAAQASPLDSSEVRLALQELESDRAQSDRL